MTTERFSLWLSLTFSSHLSTLPQQAMAAAVGIHANRSKNVTLDEKRSKS